MASSLTAQLRGTKTEYKEQRKLHDRRQVQTIEGRDKCRGLANPSVDTASGRVAVDA